MNITVEVDKGTDRTPSFKRGLDTSRIPIWYNRDMLEGKCPKCGTHRVGWSLLNPRHQTCPKCGIGLEITEDGRRISSGYSPFTADRYLITPPTNALSSHDKEKDKRKKRHRS